jgi:Spy/CpxP family protein refolding chaperone
MHPGFFYLWKRAHSCAHEAHTGQHAGAGGGSHHAGAHGGGAPFGVRRPLRVMTQELDLTPEQVEKLARILDLLKTERAQAAVDERRSVGLIADALLGDAFGNDKAREALDLRVKGAERLRDAILSALDETHAMLDPQQRKKLVYLLRSGSLTI